MQCPSCGFQNLPGLAECARCLSALSLGDVDVQPYRAAQRWVRWRHRRWRRRNLPPLWSRAVWYIAGEWERAGLSSRSRGPGEPTLKERTTWVAASILPGLGHLLVGEKRRGRWLLVSFVLALLFSLAFMSSAWTFFIAITLGIHTYAFVDAIFRRGPFRQWQPVLVSLMVLPALMYGLYQPIGWLAGGLARLEPLNAPAEGDGLRTGDVLLTPGRWISQRPLQVGDVVSYRLHAQQGQGWYTRAGVNVDRILAGPKDRVTIRDRQIRVNGRALPVNRGPLAHVSLYGEHDLVVPEGSYFIVPSLARYRGYGNNAAAMETQLRLGLSVVSSADVQGRVIAVVNPLHRIRRF